MKQVMQYTYQARSKAEAKTVADALRQQEGCIDARVYVWSVTAHFDIEQDVPEAALPEGCCLVPESVVAFLQRINGHGVVKQL